MPNQNLHTATTDLSITLDDIRKYYFEHTKHTLKVEDAKYLLERAVYLNINRQNGGVEALFSSLKYKFEEGSEG